MLVRLIGALLLILKWAIGALASLLMTAATILLIAWVVVLILPQISAVPASIVLGYAAYAALYAILAWLAVAVLFVIGWGMVMIGGRD